ncbi:MAG TPA: response regulator [Blastocatellia bacterium]|nr:response regulator [Blastocatellia bacterium]
MAEEQKKHFLLASQPELTGKRLLIVDDNATNRTIVTKQSESWGMIPHTAASGAEALDMLDRMQEFDVAVLDMLMPEMDGLTLATEIRRRTRTLPLIMLTSVGRQELAQPDSPSEFASTEASLPAVEICSLRSAAGMIFSASETR